MIDLLTGVVLPALVFVLMMFVGMGLRHRDFATVAQRPRSLVIGTVAQAIVAPVVALTAIVVLRPAPVLAAALALLSVCPSGALSNFYTVVARGNVALSVCLTTVGSLLSIVVTPVLAMVVFAVAFEQETAFQVPPATVLSQLGQFVLAPVLIGMAIGHKFRAFVDANRATWMVFAFAFLLIVVAIAVAQSWRDLVEMFWAVAALALVFTIGALIVGHLVALLVHPRDRIATGIECAVRNIPVALLLAGGIADDTKVVAFAAGYFVVQAPLLVGFSLIASMRAGRTPEP
jgi:BASS family bile acid:Na+ symporter